MTALRLVAPRWGGVEAAQQVRSSNAATAEKTFDGTIHAFHFDKSHMVSIWVATVPRADFPKDYFKENYGDDDEPFTEFSEDFRLGFYDHDFVENNSAKKPTALEKLLTGSYADSYAPQPWPKPNGEVWTRRATYSSCSIRRTTRKRRRSPRVPLWNSWAAFPTTIPIGPTWTA